MKNIALSTTLLILFMLGCTLKSSKAEKGDEKKVLLSTKYGNMVILLYDETPQHRDNFLKLVEDGFYNDLLFHRVIKGFMIQGGDPDSKDAAASKRLGSGGPGYQIPAEFVEGLYHKKGALSAARTGDNVNPERKSSGSQFYIVQGKVYDEEMLNQYEDRQRFQATRSIAMNMFQERMDDVQRLQKEGKMDSINLIKIDIQEKAEAQAALEQHEISQERRKIYSTVGGTPHLDGAYTVFGEVIEGLNVIDSISNVKTDEADRPLQDVIMEMKIIE